MSDDTLTREQRIEWMAVWAAKHDFKLELTGEVGFGRPCVGITKDGSYPDYHWYDQAFDPIDDNGDVWKPEDAYHKHPCVAVLGQGEKAEAQLYQWLRWLDSNGFVHDNGSQEFDPKIPPALAIALGKHRYTRMVRKTGG